MIRKVGEGSRASRSRMLPWRRVGTFPRWLPTLTAAARGWCVAEVASVRRRFHRLDRTATSAAARLPLSILLVIASFFATAAMTRPALGSLPASVRGQWAWSVNLTLSGQPWRILTAIMLTRDLWMLVSLSATTSLLLVLAGRLAGRGVALMTWLVGAASGYVGTTLVVTALVNLGWEVAQRAATTLDYGPSAGTAALSALVVTRMRHRAVTLSLGGALLIGSVLHRQIADAEHLVAFACVLLVTGSVDRLAHPADP